MPQPCPRFACGCICHACDEAHDAVHRMRAVCAACNGNTDRCTSGGAGHRRLKGCAAFTADGDIATHQAPLQPWTPRRRAAA